MTFSRQPEELLGGAFEELSVLTCWLSGDFRSSSAEDILEHPADLPKT